MAGYSKNPLSQKLGLRPGFRVYIANAPTDFLPLLGPLPDEIEVVRRIGKPVDYIHLFTTHAAELTQLARFLTQIKPDGMIWVSWPKRASKVQTDVTEDVIRSAALPLGLVDIKVCAIDDTWSGLKLVIRREHRPVKKRTQPVNRS